MQNNTQIDQILRQKCEAEEIPGVVAMAATGNEVIYQGAFGKRDLSKDDSMTLDSVFWSAVSWGLVSLTELSSMSAMSMRLTAPGATVVCVTFLLIPNCVSVVVFL